MKNPELLSLARLAQGNLASPLQWDAERGRYLTVADIAAQDEATANASFLIAFGLLVGAALIGLAFVL